MFVVCVRSRETREADANTATILVERMRQDGILLSTDAPLHDVIKIKPLLVFRESDAGHFLFGLERALVAI